MSEVLQYVNFQNPSTKGFLVKFHKNVIVCDYDIFSIFLGLRMVKTHHPFWYVFHIEKGGDMYVSLRNRTKGTNQDETR